MHIRLPMCRTDTSMFSSQNIPHTLHPAELQSRTAPPAPLQCKIPYFFGKRSIWIFQLISAIPSSRKNRAFSFKTLLFALKSHHFYFCIIIHRFAPFCNGFCVFCAVLEKNIRFFPGAEFRNAHPIYRPKLPPKTGFVYIPHRSDHLRHRQSGVFQQDHRLFHS